MVDGVSLAPCDLFLGHPVVEHAGPIPDVTQAIPLARTLQTEVVQHVVEENAARLVHDLVAYDLATPLLVPEAIDRCVEGEDRTSGDQPGRGRDPFRRQ